jgi:hypothetical protein
MALAINEQVISEVQHRSALIPPCTATADAVRIVNTHTSLLGEE